MGKQSKWKDVEFAPGDFASNYSPDFILDVCEVVMNSAKEAISKGDKEILLSAIRALYFPDTLYNYIFPFNMADDLANVAELLWYRNAPNPTLIKKYAALRNLSEDAAKEELNERCADDLYVQIIHAWRLLDGDFPEKFGHVLFLICSPPQTTLHHKALYITNIRNSILTCSRAKSILNPLILNDLSGISKKLFRNCRKEKENNNSRLQS